MKTYDVIIIGGGPSGLGVARCLQLCKIKNFTILEGKNVASTFYDWPAQMKFITPSFIGNQFGAVDLNSISPDTSPGLHLQKEHPNGLEYAKYINTFSSHFKIPIISETLVIGINKTNNIFIINTNKVTYKSRFVIWAGGEYSNPKTMPNTFHISSIKNYDILDKKHYNIIGGYESGSGLATYLSSKNIKIDIYDKQNPWKDWNTDPSKVLSVYTYENFLKEKTRGFITTHPNTYIHNTQLLNSPDTNILCTGFVGSSKQVSNLFYFDIEQKPVLDKNDQSTKIENIFLCGPEVRQGKNIFCFVYKFRQRFPVVASAIANKLGKSSRALSEYKRQNMWLTDLSCCEDECKC